MLTRLAGAAFRTARLLTLLGGLSVFAGETAEAGSTAIVIEANTGAVLYERGADARKFPASLAKLMTLYLLFEALDDGRLTLDQQLPTSARAAGQPPSTLWLKRGQTIEVGDAIPALVTKSANDVATVVAEALGKTEWRFAQMMTRRGRELGMGRTAFRNASGLPDARQRTTARDMARLARALRLNFPHYYRYFSLRDFRFRGRLYRSHNRLLASYPGAEGMKTGYIRASGYNLVASASRDGRRLIGVILGGRSARWRDREMGRLLDRAFESRTGAVAALPRPAHKPLAPTAAGETVWALQVGAYAHAQAARVALTRVQRYVPGIAARGAPLITPVVTAEGRLYRARVVGLSRDDAVRGCGILIGRKIPCSVLRFTVEGFSFAMAAE